MLDSDSNYVTESGVNGLFGGEYPIDSQDIRQEECDVVYIGVLPSHWGHFLRDTVSRLWYVARNLTGNYKIAFCGWNWPGGRITGNYLQFFELLGIKEDRLLFVRTPISVKKIIIPERTLGINIAKREYMEAIDIVVRSALEGSKTEACFDKIYFTRTQFLKSKLNEVGEKEIEKCFQAAGFEVMAPEKMSLKDQILYINGCSYMASMTGTIPHNIIFARHGTSLILLNRTCKANLTQIRINKIVEPQFVYIDVYTKWALKHPIDYGKGPIQIEANDNLRRYLTDQGWKVDKVSFLKKIISKIKSTAIFNLLRVYVKVRESKRIRPIYEKAKKIYYRKVQRNHKTPAEEV